jgi:hypothetical protein
VEFLIRDVGQYTEDCPARDQQKLHTQFRVALTVVSLAKAAYWLPLETGKARQLFNDGYKNAAHE